MRILVTGVGRSGTTWFSTTLGTTPGTGVVREPDTIAANPFAMRALAGLGNNPVVSAGESGPPDLARLWDAAFGARLRYVPGQQRVASFLFGRATVGQRKAACHPTNPHATMQLRLAGALAVPWRARGLDNHLVKSIRLPFALEWVAARWQPVVVLCRRHPLDVVASQIELRHDHDVQWLAPAVHALAAERYGVPAPETDDRVVGVAWRIGLSMSALDDAQRAHPEFHVVDHELLCRDPVGEFHRLVDAVGLEWTSAVEAHVAASNRAGTGYELTRVAAEQPGKWRERLSVDDARNAARVLAQFPIAQYYELDIDA